jgi:glutamyl-tRNA synthetase
MVNFLVLLGWATTASRELFEPAELIAAFDLAGISRTNSVFHIQPDDPKFITDPKLLSINAHYLRTMSLDDLHPYVKAQLTAGGLWDPDFDGVRRQWFDQAVDLMRERFHRLTDFVHQGGAFFSDTFPMVPGAQENLLSGNPPVGDWLPALSDTLAAVAPFDQTSVEAALRAFLGQWRIKPGHLINALRIAVTGQTVGPDMIQVLLCLGRDRVVARLNKFDLNAITGS